MPVTDEQVRLHIQDGMDRLCTTFPLAEVQVILWLQGHPDGPDWAVDAAEFMAWFDAQPAQDKLPSMSLAITPSRRTIHVNSTRNGGAITQQATFRPEPDGSDLPQTIADAARHYVDQAVLVFAGYR